MQAGEGGYRLSFLVDLQSELDQAGLEEVRPLLVVVGQGVDDFVVTRDIFPFVKVDSGESARVSIDHDGGNG